MEIDRERIVTGTKHCHYNAGMTNPPAPANWTVLHFKAVLFHATYTKQR